MANFTNESFIISRTLNQIGYSRYMRTVRQDAVKRIEASMNRESPIENIFSGSKAEGLSAPCENDIDMMFVVGNTVCSEYPMRYCSGEQRNVFQLLQQSTPPGYAILQLSNMCDNLSGSGLIKHCLWELSPGQLYISSDDWKYTFKQGLIESYLEQGNRGFGYASNYNHGPSIVTSIFQINQDNVLAMVCDCPSYLYSWVTRERQHNWPTPDVIEEVSELESHVVPIGNINSPLQCMEWRICYTKGEIRLIRSLPDCLIKVYILMKAIVKVTLKSICKEMSSYIIKNIVLWIAERNTIECFSETKLVTVVQHGFKFLKHCLVEKNLPSYMIPERNLFADRLTLQQRSRLCMRIDCLLREGPRVVLKVKKMRDALNMLYRTPEEFRLYFERRQIIETLILILNVYVDSMTYVRNCFTDDIVIRINHMICRLDPELAATFQNGNATSRKDPEYIIEQIRDGKFGLLSKTNPLLKYLC